MFQNSEIQPSEKKTELKLIIVAEFNILPSVLHDIQIWVFLTQFWDDDATTWG